LWWVFWGRVLGNYVPHLTQNFDPPDLCLLSSCGYRRETLAPAWISYGTSDMKLMLYVFTWWKCHLPQWHVSGSSLFSRQMRSLHTGSLLISLQSAFVSWGVTKLQHVSKLNSFRNFGLLYIVLLSFLLASHLC
jgi:hypothetical protein